jgi:hypothetical protein
MKLIAGLWKRWLKIAAVIGEVQALIIFTAIYFLVVAPIALAMKLISDPLAYRSRKRSSFWVARNGGHGMTLEEARRL